MIISSGSHAKRLEEIAVIERINVRLAGTKILLDACRESRQNVNRQILMLGEQAGIDIEELGVLEILERLSSGIHSGEIGVNVDTSA
jgi:hypothetical protein